MGEYVKIPKVQFELMLSSINNIVNWHNKNLTKQQYYDLDEVLCFLNKAKEEYENTKR